MRYFLLLAIGCMPLLGMATTDTLIAQYRLLNISLPQAPPDTNIVNQSHSVFWGFYQRQAYDSAMAVAVKAADLAQQIGFKRGYAGMLRNQSVALVQLNHIIPAIHALATAETIYKNLNYQPGLCNVQFDYGAIYTLKGIYSLAKDLLLNNTYIQSTTDADALIAKNVNLFWVETALGNKENAIMHEQAFLKAFIDDEICGKQAQQQLLALQAYNNKQYAKALAVLHTITTTKTTCLDLHFFKKLLMSDCHLALNQLDSAAYYTKDALNTLPKIASYKSIGLYQNLYKIYGMQQDYEQAYKYSIKIDSINQRLNNQRDEVIYTIINLKNKKIQEGLMATSKLNTERYETYQLWGVFVTLALILLFLLVYNNQKAAYNNKLKAQNEVLIARNSELDTLLYRASHDIRAPLLTLLGLIHLMKPLKEEPHDNTNEYKRNAILTIKKLDYLLGKINNISIVRKVTPSINWPTINVAKNIKEQILVAKTVLQLSKEVEVSVRVAPDCQLKTEPSNFNLLIRNLLENAIKYAAAYQAAPKVEIAAETKNGKLIFRVTDNGPGIDPTLQDQIFEMFFKAGNKAHGAGLGLYKAKLAAKNLNGKLYYRNLENQPGAMFFFEHPIV